MHRVNARPLTDTQDRLFIGNLFFVDVIGGDSLIVKRGNMYAVSHGILSAAQSLSAVHIML